MLINVFIQNEAGTNKKNYFNEKTLEFKYAKTVSRNYPFPYGFIIGTSALDNCNIDCFVITNRLLKTGQIIQCEAIGLMEQIEDGIEDHNVLAKFSDERINLTSKDEAILTDFVLNVFQHIEGKQISVGRFLDREQARAHINANLETN